MRSLFLPFPYLWWELCRRAEDRVEAAAGGEEVILCPPKILNPLFGRLLRQLGSA
jgi:hypothetical protein